MTRIDLDATIRVLTAVVNAEHPRTALPTIASNNQLTLEQVRAVITQHGWPDTAAMSAACESLRDARAARGKPPETVLTDAEPGQLVRIRVSQLVPDPANVRENIGDVSDLVASIREIGLLQPPVVRRRGDQFVVVMGHRRRAALIGAGHEYCDVIISAIRPDDVLVAMIVENTQRADLDPIEEARAIAQLKEREDLTDAGVAERIGRSQPHVSGRLALLDLSADDQAAIRAGTMTLTRGTQIGRHASGKERKGAWGKDSAAHLSSAHPLASAVQIVCRQNGHSKFTAGYIGGIGCGRCWETVIRSDEGNQIARRSRRPQPTADEPEEATA